MICEKLKKATRAITRRRVGGMRQTFSAAMRCLKQENPCFLEQIALEKIANH
jgi:hypothetical protein